MPRAPQDPNRTSHFCGSVPREYPLVGVVLAVVATHIILTNREMITQAPLKYVGGQHAVLSLPSSLLDTMLSVVRASLSATLQIERYFFLSSTVFQVIPLPLPVYFRFLTVR